MLLPAPAAGLPSPAPAPDAREAAAAPPPLRVWRTCAGEVPRGGLPTTTTLGQPLGASCISSSCMRCPLATALLGPSVPAPPAILPEELNCSVVCLPILGALLPALAACPPALLAALAACPSALLPALAACPPALLPAPPLESGGGRCAAARCNSQLSGGQPSFFLRTNSQKVAGGAFSRLIFIASDRGLLSSLVTIARILVSTALMVIEPLVM